MTRTMRSGGEDEQGTTEGAGGVTRQGRRMRVESGTKLAMTRTRIDDDNGGRGGSKPDLGEGEDDGGGSGSRCRA
jgi:hypothetical protein